MKWKIGKLNGFSKVISLIVRFNLHVSIAQVHCSDPATWQGFFAQGDAFVKSADVYRPQDRLRSGDFAPAAMLKTYLLADGFARLKGWILRERYPWGSGPVEIDIHFIADNDFSDTVTAKTFAERVDSAARRAPSIPAQLGVVPVVKSLCLTEQDEPLLLLPDYLAGVYHHAEPRARLGKPIASAAAAQAAVADLHRRHSKIRVEEDEFDGAYPLGWEARGQAVP